jgi:hypothetical protein
LKNPQVRVCQGNVHCDEPEEKAKPQTLARFRERVTEKQIIF